MNSEWTIAIRRGAMLLPLLLLCGCGGGGGGHTSSDALEILRQDGLVLTLDSDKTRYDLGDEIRCWFSVRNDGASTRTLDLHPRGDEMGGRTSLASITYDDGTGTHVLVYTLSRVEAASTQVGPGETVRLAEFVWSQIRQDTGQAAGAGYYDVAIVLDNLYVDGRKPADWPTFEVPANRQVIVQKWDNWVDPRELLRAEGLVVSLGLEKVIYQKGEPIPIWFEVKNEGTQTRTLEARPLVLVSLPTGADFRPCKSGSSTRSGELETCSGGFMYYTPDGHDYVGAQGFVRFDTVQMDVPPGETVRFIEYIWNQVNWDGSPAQAGYYDAYMRVSNLYVDGQHLSDVASFQVDVYASIRIDE